MDDLDDASDRRGCSLDLEELPGEIVETEDEVLAVLSDIEASADAAGQRRRRFTEVHCPQECPEGARLTVDEIVRRRCELSF